MTDAKFAKVVVWVNGLVPAALLAWDYNHGGLGADPSRFAVHTTGMVALIFLALTLLVTPVRQLTGWTWVYGVRRSLGLFAFYYAVAHLVLYTGWWQAWNLSATVSEIFSHTYLTLGFIALTLMAPLWATSFDAAIRKLGAVKWKWLHWLIYVTVVLGALHYFLQSKSKTVLLPQVFLGVFGVLLGYRVVAYFVMRWRNRVAIARGEKRWSGVMRAEKIVQETGDVKTFRLAPAHGGDVAFPYKAGQFLTLELPIGGKSVRRSYTIASTPTRSGAIEVTIKRSPTGVSSVYMHDKVQEGELIRIMAASGKFVFDGENQRGVVMLAGGVGITPLMSIVRFLTDRAWPGDIYLIYSNKTESDVIFRREIEDLAARFPNLHVTMTLTRDDSRSWMAHTGRIDAALLTRAVPELAKLPIYICGPGDMLRATRELLRGLGVPEDNIHTESFGAKPAGAALSPDGAPVFQVTFARSHKTVAIPADRSILEAAEEHNIPAEFECRSGICGTCKCRLMAGTVAMAAEDALTPADRADNIILLCQSRALEDVTVNL